MLIAHTVHGDNIRTQGDEVLITNTQEHKETTDLAANTIEGGFK